MCSNLACELEPAGSRLIHKNFCRKSCDIAALDEANLVWRTRHIQRPKFECDLDLRLTFSIRVECAAAPPRITNQPAAISLSHGLARAP